MAMNRDDYTAILEGNGYSSNEAYVAANTVSQKTSRDLTFQEIEDILYPYSIEVIKGQLADMPQGEVERILEHDKYHEYVSEEEMNKLVHEYLKPMLKKWRTTKDIDSKHRYYFHKDRTERFVKMITSL